MKISNFKFHPFDELRTRISNFRKGFTLIELMVVFTVVASIAGIGVASFNTYNEIQKVNRVFDEVTTTLFLAKSRAQSQVKPATCIDVLEGYRVSIPSDDSYVTSMVCNNGISSLEIDSKTYTLPPNVRFSSGVGSQFTFRVLTGGVEGAVIAGSQVRLTGFSSISRIFTVFANGRIVPEPPGATIIPTPTAFIPTPTPTAIPLPSVTPLPMPTPTLPPSQYDYNGGAYINRNGGPNAENPQTSAYTCPPDTIAVFTGFSAGPYDINLYLCRGNTGTTPEYTYTGGAYFDYPNDAGEGNPQVGNSHSCPSGTSPLIIPSCSNCTFVVCKKISGISPTGIQTPTRTPTPTPQLADLFVFSLNLVPASGPYYDTNTYIMSAVVKNQGTVSAAENTGRFCINDLSCTSGTNVATPALAANASTSPALAAPWIPLSAGTHTVTFCADVGNTVAETNEGTAVNCASIAVSVTQSTNSSSCGTISAPAGPILIDSTFSGSVTMNNIGTRVWSDDIGSGGNRKHNLGSANPQDNLTWGFGRVFLPNRTTDRIAPGQSVIFTKNFTAPSAPGTYPFAWRMVEDPVEWFGPICTQNIIVGAPDLYISDLRVTSASPYYSGNSLTFSGAVTNQGNTTAPSSTARFCIDNTSCTGTNTTGRIGTDVNVSALTATAPNSASFTSSAWSATVGTHTITFCSDVATPGAVTESNETNNCATQTFTVNPLPPPTVTTNAASTITSSGATLNGSANPNNFATTGWFRYSNVYPGSCNDSFGTRIPATSGTNLGSGSTSIPYSQFITGLSGNTTYYYCAIASNTAGTAFGAVQSFATPIPDLYPSALFIASASSYWSDTQYTFSVSVGNQGSGASLTSSEGKICLDSASCALSSWVGSVTIPPLNSGEISAVLTTNVAPAVGTHNYYFCVDTGNTITESNEGNNCSSAITLTAYQRCNSSAIGSNYLFGCAYDGTNFNTLDASTNPSATITDSRASQILLLQSWTTQGPSSTTGTETYSIRWKGDITFQPGSYTFYAKSDDGVREFLGTGSITNILNNSGPTPSWSDHNNSIQFSANPIIYRTATTVLVTVEYYQNLQNASVEVGWNYYPLDPDLYVYNLNSAPSGPYYENGSYSFQAIAANQGTDPSAATTGRFCIDNTNCTGVSITGRLGTDVSISALNPASTTSTINSSSWTATLGSHTLTFCSDVGNTVSESFENNNCSTLSFSVNKSKRVFVTSSTQNANLGGLAGADDTCRTLAQTQGMTQFDWKAWLSSDPSTNQTPLNRFSNTFEYRNMDIFRLINGSPIAVNWSALTSQLLLNPINIDESGFTVPPSNVWTNTTSTGFSDGPGACVNWTSSLPGLARVGTTTQTSSNWSSDTNADCSTSQRLYCFEQDEPFQASTPSPGPVSYLRVFMTKNTYTVNQINGAANAKNICQNIANTKGFGGVWETWISDNSSSPNSRFSARSKGTLPFKLIDGTTPIASSWLDLIDGNLQNPINKDEDGTLYTSPRRVWTATGPDGSLQTFAGPSVCSNWTSTNPAENVAAGDYNQFFAPGWTDAGPYSCGNSSPVYCFEQ